MNAARLDRSARLRRVARLLADGRPRTTLQIASAARVCAVSTVVSELRQNGLAIACQRVGNKWYYWMEMGHERHPKG